MSKERKLLTRVAFETVHNNGISEKLYGEIETCLAEPAQEPKPVAWLRNDRQVVLQNRQNGYDIPLYETPPSATKRIAELESACKAHAELHEINEKRIVELEGRIDELALIRARLESRINNGVRVYAWLDDGVVRMDDSLNNTKHCTATLILDEQGE
jgi:hypothetical protein